MITTINEFRKVMEGARETMTFWHGGNLDTSTDVSHKTGRWEYGPGLYLTTQFDVVQKYAKGSRKLYRVVVEKGVDLHSVMLPVPVVLKFVGEHAVKNKVKEVAEVIERLKKNDTINAEVFMNVLINRNAIRNSEAGELRQFFVDNGIDYSMVDNAFGWHEKMMILFNTKKIVSKEVVSSTRGLDTYNFPNEFVSESFDRASYLRWKRKNVSYRGMKEVGQENGSGAMLGDGLYTAALSNKTLARQYGNVYFAVNAIPKNPLKFNTLNEWEIWFQGFVLKTLGYERIYQFHEKSDIATELKKLGYDGVIIRGREMVNYSPPSDVMYFRTENELMDWYEDNVKFSNVNEGAKPKDVLYRNTSQRWLINLLNDGKIKTKHHSPTAGSWISISKNEASGDTGFDFGNCHIVLDKNMVYAQGAIDVEYTVEFFAKHPDIAKHVTGYTQDEFLKDPDPKSWWTIPDKTGEELNMSLWKMACEEHANEEEVVIKELKYEPGLIKEVQIEFEEVDQELQLLLDRFKIRYIRV